MAAPFVQNGATNVVATGVNQPTITSVGAGHQLIAVLGIDAINTAVAAPTDSAGQTWFIAKTFANAAGSGAIAWLPSANAGTHTLSWPTQANITTSAISEWNGLTAIGGAGVTNSATAATLTSASYTPGSASEVVIAWLWEAGFQANDALHCNTAGFQSIGSLSDSTPHSCWSINQNGNTQNGVEANAQVVTSNAALTCAWSWAGSVFSFSIVQGFTLSTGQGSEQTYPYSLGRLGFGRTFKRLRAIYDDTVSSSGPTTISGIVGAYSWAGTTSSASGLINEAIGSYTWAGTTATTNSVLNAIVGAYTWSGTTAINSGLINGAVGSYSWAGTNSNLVENIAQGIGAYSWAGTTSTTSQLINSDGGVTAYTWSGTTSSLGGPINATVGGFTWSGTTSSVPTIINSDGGALAYSWAGTTSTTSQLINGGIGVYTWAGITATIPGSSPASLASVYPFISNVGTLMGRS